MRRRLLVAVAFLGGVFSALGAPPTTTPSPAPQPSSFPTDASHPLKLNFPFGWIGELKLPTKDELIYRDKLETVADLTDLQIRDLLEKWPPYNSMSLSDQGKMLQRIQDFRDRRNKLAQDEAQKLGLTTLSPADQQAFTKLFWLRRRQADEALLADFQAKYDAKQGEIDHEMEQVFAPRLPSPKPVSAPTPKPSVAPKALEHSPKPPSVSVLTPTPIPKPTPSPKPIPSKSP
jgi:hypothetical protein